MRNECEMQLRVAGLKGLFDMVITRLSGIYKQFLSCKVMRRSCRAGLGATKQDAAPHHIIQLSSSNNDWLNLMLLQGEDMAEGRDKGLSMPPPDPALSPY